MKKIAQPAAIDDRPSRRGAGGGARELRVTTLRRQYGEFYRRDVTVPFLRLSGAWLRDLGFESGSRVTVSAEAGVLVLRLSEAAEDRPKTSTATSPAIRR